MAKIIEKKVRHIKCDECGNEFPIWSKHGIDTCICGIAYKTDGDKIETLGYKCWHCEEYKPHIYREDNVCSDCMWDMMDYWSEKVDEAEENLKFCKKRFKDAENLWDGSMEDR